MNLSFSSHSFFTTQFNFFEWRINWEHVLFYSTWKMMKSSLEPPCLRFPWSVIVVHYFKVFNIPWNAKFNSHIFFLRFPQYFVGFDKSITYLWLAILLCWQVSNAKSGLVIPDTKPNWPNEVLVRIFPHSDWKRTRIS